MAVSGVNLSHLGLGLVVVFLLVLLKLVFTKPSPHFDADLPPSHSDDSQVEDERAFYLWRRYSWSLRISRARKDCRACDSPFSDLIIG